MNENKVFQFGNRIRQFRKARGYKEKDVADIAGISYSTYSNYENDNRTPNRSQLEKIASALDVTMLDLIGVSPVEEVVDNGSELRLNSLIQVDSTLYQISSISVSNSLERGEEVIIKGFKPRPEKEVEPL